VIPLRRPRAGAHARRGLSVVETSIAVSLFLILLLGFFDVSRALFARLTLQHAVREAGRFAVTGRTLEGAGGMLNREQSIEQVLAQYAAPHVPAPGDVWISSTSGGPGSAGGPGDTLTIRVRYRLQLITFFVGQWFPNHEYVIDTSTTFRNEPFPPVQGIQGS